MKISVLGAGAVGSMLGGLLKYADPTIDLRLFARGEHRQAMQQQGHVVLDGPWGSRNSPVRVAENIDELAGSNYVLFTVKSQDTLAAIQEAAPHLGTAVLVSIQNGINHRQLAGFVAPDRLVMGMTGTNMAILRPGSVSLQLEGMSVVGAPPGEPLPEAAIQAANLLAATGLPFMHHENLIGVQYNKLAINILGSAAALSSSNFITEAVLYRPWRVAIAIPLIDEIITVYQTSGIKLSVIPGIPDVYKFRRFLRVLDVPMLGFLARTIANRRFNRKPILFSVHQDLARARKTEIDFICGELVRLADEHRVAAQFNREVIRIVHELEQRGRSPFLDRAEVIARFARLSQ